MQTIKTVTVICAVIVMLALGGWVTYLELFIVPDLLTRQFGQMSTLLHLSAILFLVIGAWIVSAWVKERNIFQTHEKLISSHLNSILDAIDNLTTGRWSSDSYTHRDAFKTGASLGYKLGQASPEIDRSQIVDGIGRMALPEGRQVTGQDTSVIGEMSGYFDEMAARKQRLSD